MCLSDVLQSTSGPQNKDQVLLDNILRPLKILLSLHMTASAKIKLLPTGMEVKENYLLP